MDGFEKSDVYTEASVTPMRDQREQAKRANTHATVKPVALMQHLVRLITPPGGVCLDLFMDSGSTGKACMREGFDFIGIEREAEYMPIATARIEHAASQAGQPVQKPSPKRYPKETEAAAEESQGVLF